MGTCLRTVDWVYLQHIFTSLHWRNKFTVKSLIKLVIIWVQLKDLHSGECSLWRDTQLNVHHEAGTQWWCHSLINPLQSLLSCLRDKHLSECKSVKTFVLIMCSSGSFSCSAVRNVFIFKLDRKLTVKLRLSHISQQRAWMTLGLIISCWVIVMLHVALEHEDVSVLLASLHQLPIVFRAEV